MPSNEISNLMEQLRRFNQDRDWEQFHNPKDLVIAINIESAELLELFLWKQPNEADIAKVKEELADIFCFALLLADKYQIDITQIIKDKIAANELRYPIEKAKGNAKKYNEL